VAELLPALVRALLDERAMADLLSGAVVVAEALRSKSLKRVSTINSWKLTIALKLLLRDRTDRTGRSRKGTGGVEERR
jgi:hypothetical protein